MKGAESNMDGLSRSARLSSSWPLMDMDFQRAAVRSGDKGSLTKLY